MEKIHQKTKSKAKDRILRIWQDYMDQSLVKKIDEQFLVQYLLPYYQKNKRFTRKFWENPDANDLDVTLAFRKRKDDVRMTLRRNE